MRKQKKYVLGILVCLMLMLASSGIIGQAASPENVMQSSKAVSGKLEITRKGVRYYNNRTKKYEKKKWLKVKNNIYYFTSTGYAKTGWKTHNGRRYYFDQKGSHVQFNVVSRETLLDAQKHPENYQTLVVRVAGYSALFTSLSKSLQDDIINRTEQTFGGGQ